MVVLKHPNIKDLTIERTGDDVAKHEKAGWVRESKPSSSSSTAPKRKSRAKPKTTTPPAKTDQPVVQPATDTDDK